MKSDTLCPVCNTSLGRHHGNEQPEVVSVHIREFHPLEYKEIEEVANSVDDVWKNYKIHHMNLFYYHTRGRR